MRKIYLVTAYLSMLLAFSSCLVKDGGTPGLTKEMLSSHTEYMLFCNVLGMGSCVTTAVLLDEYLNASPQEQTSSKFYFISQNILHLADDHIRIGSFEYKVSGRLNQVGSRWTLVDLGTIEATADGWLYAGGSIYGGVELKLAVSTLGKGAWLVNGEGRTVDGLPHHSEFTTGPDGMVVDKISMLQPSLASGRLSGDFSLDIYEGTTLIDYVKFHYLEGKLDFETSLDASDGIR